MSTDGSRRRDVTVADVAKAAKVSKAQAARALGNYGAVSDDVRERVLAAAEELEYRPNELARSMNTGRSNTIGVVVGDIENPHFGLAMRGITDTAKKSGYNVILINTDEERAAEVDAVRVLLDKRVDGLIVAPASSVETSHLQQVQDSGRPLVLLDRAAQGLDAETFAVDMGGISYESTKYLIESGHQRIAFVSTLKTDRPYEEGMVLDSSQISDRLEGIRRAFKDEGLALPADLVRLNAGDSESVKAITRGLLEGPDPATAIIASDGLIALGVVEAIQEAGLAIPADVSFLMYDDFAWTRLTTPPLTVIAQPVYDMGIAAATALIRRIEGRKAAAPTPELAARLIQRGSVGAPQRTAVRASS
ncbi:LacI family transcriptional regulator [Paenarthrobacter nicotinovorans]|uniref:LacI family DNA-binding transcriptional regulator n=1 Tax=Micrococcaceae TaxID=1268 RepID=UPI000876F5C7|nr:MULTISPECIES: LacI family DNA-binding transcriptional regulator [Micrococcaceae]MDR6437893.1 LacI family transcriptional regulator [Paenarthrobacter nicotinovorans]SCZ64665.1 transcriptional regulator, LacI family [Arthrobacter sp. UNCCL28]